jgi:endonuclease YncB( thermonuclease family)
MGQPYGPAATRAMQKLARGKPVAVDVETRGPYGRLIATVQTSDYDVGRSLVHSGYAWADRKHGHTRRLSSLEQQARQEGAGLWSQESPVPPWQHRDTTGPTQGAGQNVGWGAALFVVIVVGLLSLLSLAAG